MRTIAQWKRKRLLELKRQADTLNGLIDDMVSEANQLTGEQDGGATMAFDWIWNGEVKEIDRMLAGAGWKVKRNEE